MHRSPRQRERALRTQKGRDEHEHTEHHNNEGLARMGRRCDRCSPGRPHRAIPPDRLRLWGLVDGGVVQELMVVCCEFGSWLPQNTTVAESAVSVLTVIGDIACDSLSLNEKRTYTAPGGTELHVIAPSDSLVSHGFALGPVVMPPLDEGACTANVSVHVIVWATNLFHTQDVPGTMLTVNVRRNEEDVALVNLAPPLRFFHENVRQDHTGWYGRVGPHLRLLEYLIWELERRRPVSGSFET